MPEEITDEQLGLLILGVFAGFVQMDQFPIKLHMDDPFPEVNREEGYFVFRTESGLKYKTTVSLV